MRRILNRFGFLICLSVFFLLPIKAQRESPFRMLASKDVESIVVDKIFLSNDHLNLFDTPLRIYGLSVDMVIEALTPEFLVRILLTDSEEKKHLVAEVYKETSDKTFMTFTDYSEETSLLDGITPSQLLIYIKDAKVHINSIRIANSPSNQFRSQSSLQASLDSVRVLQAQSKVESINQYNKSHHKLWRAGVTQKSLLPFKKKMSLIGCPDSISTGGIEYYAGGIFEFGSLVSDNYRLQTLRTTNSGSIESFDWRNVHGKNWITSVKDQGHFPYCTAFASIGTLESGVQLFYNQIMDSLDLSEKDVIVNHVAGEPLFMIAHDGSWSWMVLDYLKNHGVYDEDSYPFYTTIPYSSVQPKMIVSINDYDSIRSPMTTKEEKKMALIAKGPMVSGYSYHGNGGHAMELIGFGTVQENMEILYHKNLGSGHFLHDTVPIPQDDRRIGDTYWVFKNSYGNDNPYMSILFDNEYYNMDGPYYLKTPISMTLYDDFGNVTKEYSENDIICEDADGDGFFFWGTGPKPESCPGYAMEEADFDDSNPLIGAINANGVIENLNPEELDTLDANSFFDLEYTHNCYNHIVVSPGYFDIIDDIHFHNGAKIFMRSGAILELYDGTLYDAEIIMEPGSKLTVNYGAGIKLRQGVSFNPPLGAIVEINHGFIE